MTSISFTIYLLNCKALIFHFSQKLLFTKIVIRLFSKIKVRSQLSTFHSQDEYILLNFNLKKLQITCSQRLKLLFFSKHKSRISQISHLSIGIYNESDKTSQGFNGCYNPYFHLKIVRKCKYWHMNIYILHITNSMIFYKGRYTFKMHLKGYLNCHLYTSYVNQ